MKLSQIAALLPLTLRSGAAGLENEVTGGYAADLLSCAMAAAHSGDLWITLQGHLNVIAIASLNDLAGVIVTEGKPIAGDTLARAEAEGIPVFSTDLETYQVVGRLWDMGIGK